MKNPSYKDAKELQVSEIGKFSVAQFYLDQPQGHPVKQANILAQAYIDGHWIDVHISKIGKERPEQTPLLDVLQLITIK